MEKKEPLIPPEKWILAAEKRIREIHDECAEKTKALILEAFISGEVIFDRETLDIKPAPYPEGCQFCGGKPLHQPTCKPLKARKVLPSPVLDETPLQGHFPDIGKTRYASGLSNSCPFCETDERGYHHPDCITLP